MSYSPRAYQVNLSSQNTRENLILLNIVRASRFEPMNFTVLSKYTASGQLQVSGSALNNIGVDFALVRGGPTTGAAPGGAAKTALSAGGLVATNNSFDVAPLDNQDFYANFLAPLTVEKIHILVNAGLSRDVVFHSVIRAVTVKVTRDTPGGVGVFGELRFTNEPSNNSFLGDDTEEGHRRCQESIGAEAQQRPEALAPFKSRYWSGEYLRSCNYSKFLRFLKAGLEYGVTTEAVADSGKRRDESRVRLASKAQIDVIVRSQGSSGGSGGSGGGGSDGEERKRIILCFDAGIAAENNRIAPQGPQYSTCRSGKPKEDLKVKAFEPYVVSVTPVLNSAYSVFNYYGALLRSSSAHRVLLTERAIKRTEDSLLFTATNSGVEGCFASVAYNGKDYCVPNDGAGNTKQVLTLLIALVNLSTSRSSLPVTPTVLVNQ